MKNSKKRGTFGVGRRLFFTLALFLLVFAAASIVKVQAASTIMGWLGGWSEDVNIGGSMGSVDGNETGVGWISMNNANSGAGGSTLYNVTIDDAGKVSGYAWVNASNAPNSTVSSEKNGLGWIDFNPQDHCTTGTPDATQQQYKAASCSPPAGCSAGVTRNENNLTGCARMVSIAQVSVTGNNGGWDGWVKMNGSVTGGGVYGVNIDPSTGKFCAPGASTTKQYTSPINGDYHCFAWNGEEPGTGGNMANGLGYIDFAGASIEETASVTIEPNSFLLRYGTYSTRTLTAHVETPSSKISGKVVNFLRSSDKFFLNGANVNNASCTTDFNGSCTLEVSAADFDDNYTGTITASCDGCSSDGISNISTGNIEKRIICDISCPSTEITAGAIKIVPISVSGAGCSLSGCSKTDDLLEYATKSGASACEIKASSSSRYGSTTFTATAGSSSQSCSVNIKGPGWIETNP